MKKLAVFLISLLLILPGCGASNPGEGQSVPEEERSDAVIPWEDLSIRFDNVQIVDDNPWNTNAGVIDSGTDGSCVFLTPDTTAYIDLNKAEEVSFELKIHPWVAQYSDGVKGLVSLLDEKDEVLYQQTIAIGNAESYVFNVDFDSYPQCSCAAFRCEAGDSNNRDADWLIIRRSYCPDSTFTRFGYVRSATYYGEEWPINFWNSEMDNLDADMLQIKNDGFDSIILCIPWKEFQTDTDPITYSDYAFDQLKRVMDAAQQAGLGVYTRIGYCWDYWNDTGEYIFDRYHALISDPAMRGAWMDYAGQLYSQLSEYEVFRGAFLTWEDFWRILIVCNIEDEAVRIAYAKDMGYQQWVQEHYALQEYNSLYSLAYDDYGAVPIPYWQEPAAESMYAFFDEFLNSFLRQAQEVFPNCSNEVRLDADIVYDAHGNPSWYDHHATYSCEAADFTAAMYSISMGFENNGERVSAQEAVQHTQYILSNLRSQNMGKPVYVEQFLFYDNTPMFAHNARLIEGETDEYLKLAADVLPQYTAGYGIWTYRDYYNNMLFNNGFYLSELGWDCAGDISFEAVDGSMTAHLDDGGSLSQRILDIRNHFDADTYTVSFAVVQCDSPGSLRVSFGDEEQLLNIREPGSFSLTFPKTSSFDFCLIAESGDYKLDNVRLYSFVQNGCLYSPENTELEFIDSIRSLNAKLTQ